MMKKIVGALLLALLLLISIQTMANAEVNVRISLPPPIIFAAPPELVVLPETYVYVDPDIDADIYFFDGYWWRPWEGRWYRSRDYNSGWAYYNRVPSFYPGVYSGWRSDYREHRWKGQQWNYQRMPHQQVQKNWKSWKTSNHWEKQQTWGVQGLKSRQTAKPQSHQQAQPQSHQQAQPQSHQQAKPQSHEHAKPQSHQEQPQHSQEQQHGNPERGR
jgi:hypothetical protein